MDSEERMNRAEAWEEGYQAHRTYLQEIERRWDRKKQSWNEAVLIAEGPVERPENPYL